MRIPSDCLREPDLENRCGACHLCKWLRKPVVKAALVPTAERTLLVDTYASDTISDTPAFLSGADGLFLSKRRAISNMDAEPKTRLSRFIRLMGLLNKAPWANKSFSVNNAMLRRLIASHLPLIVGPAWQKHKSSLIDLIGSSDDLSTAQNIIWITNRQQGKTTTLSKFVAALSILSPVGGNLLCVYSTNLDRAQELTRAAKKYIYWLSECDAELADINVKLPVFTVDNERVYSISGENGVVNTVIARPKNPDSCRGDAPAAAIFDEIAFVTADFWFKVCMSLSVSVFFISLSLSHTQRTAVCLSSLTDLKTRLHMRYNPTRGWILLLRLYR